MYPSQLCSILVYSNSHNYAEMCPTSKFHESPCTKNSSSLASLTFNYFQSTKDSFNIGTNKYCIYEPNDCDFDHRVAYGEHLMSCRNYSCPRKYFKCPEFYCVPWRLVCNGHWECPGGMEEKLCNQTLCPGMYRCKNSSICITLDNLCDSIHDCHLNDDEHFCSMSQISNDCPLNCSCNRTKRRLALFILHFPCCKYNNTNCGNE